MEQTVYLRQGSSDKVYQASIVPQGDGYVVLFAFGRRGATLQTGTITPEPVSLEQATRIYDKLIAGKQVKGYTPGESGTPYQQTDRQSQNSGIHCQLLNPIEARDLSRCIEDPGYWAEEKFDGRRLLIRKERDHIEGINRLGLIVALPSSIEQSAKAFSGSFIMDGEAVGDALHAFDLLQRNGDDLRSRAYAERYLTLLNLIKSVEPRSIRLVETAFETSQKKALFNQLKSGNKEGVVFKRLDATYTEGRPASGGTQLKHKFCETASFIVSKVNTKRSVSLTLLHDGRTMAVGNVTIPANHAIPQPGDLVEVRYLHAFQGGSIYQPVYLGLRSGVTREECVLTQLKYKPEQVKEAA